MRRSDLLFRSDNRPTRAFAAFLTDTGIPGETLDQINEALQNRFIRKVGGVAVERWEREKVAVGCPWPRFRLHAWRCGFYAQTHPSRDSYDRAGWPGALLPRAAIRLIDLIDAWTAGVRWTENVVFGGKRVIIPARENPKAARENLDLRPLALRSRDEGEGLVLADGTKAGDEFGILKWLWGGAQIPAEMRALPTTFVDAPMKPPAVEGGREVRPNTEDPAVHWLASDPAPGTILISSGAPYGPAQDEAFWMILGPHEHEIETFGHGCPPAMEKDQDMDAIMREVAGAVYRIKRARAS